MSESNLILKLTYACRHPHALLGPNFERISKVLLLFADIFETNLVNPALTLRMANLSRQMQSSIPGPTLQSAFSQLSSEQQQKFQRLLVVVS